MKRIVCAALALSLIGSTAAIADPYDHGGRSSGYSHQDRDDYRRGDNGLGIGLGVGLLALAAVAASQHHDRNYERYDNGGYGNGRGTYYNQGGYNQGGYGYGNSYGSYGRRSYDSYRSNEYSNYSRGYYSNDSYNGRGGW